MSAQPSPSNDGPPAPIRAMTEEEVVATWLKLESHSPGRPGEVLREFIASNPAAASPIHHPDIENETDNTLRAWLLGETRGWRKNDMIFSGFPTSAQWYERELSPAELRGLRYMGGGGMAFWDALAGAGRFVGDGADRATAGLAEDSADGDLGRFRDIAQELDGGSPPTPLIVVSPSLTESGWVLIDGCHRATGYCMASRPPQTFPAFLGVAPGVAAWPRWPS